MLAYLGQYSAHVRRVTQRLRTWQPLAAAGADTILHDAARYAADIIGAPRAVVVWEDPEEPDLRMAWWAPGQPSTSRGDRLDIQPLVVEPFQDTDFLCRDAATADSTVIFTAGSGLQSAPGPAVHPGFVEQFAIRTVLAVQCRLGRIFVLDKGHLTIDDLWLAQIVARQVSSSVDQALLIQRLEETSVVEARGRVARDLHDGVLQSLTAITLRLQSIGRAVDAEVGRRIQMLQAMIADEARRLREFIGELTSPAPHTGADTLSAQLERLRQHMERDWGLRVELDTAHLPAIAGGLANDLYFVLREALVNVARHAGASMARAAVAAEGARLRITVLDDGRGFRFEGRHDGAALAAMKLAPRMLYERVTSLGGRLIVDSSAKGSRVDIEVPLADRGEAR
jgi:signal transduction histidine kinase